MTTGPIRPRMDTSLPMPSSTAHRDRMAMANRPTRGWSPKDSVSREPAPESMTIKIIYRKIGNSQPRTRPSPLPQRWQNASFTSPSPRSRLPASTAQANRNMAYKSQPAACQNAGGAVYGKELHDFLAAGKPGTDQRGHQCAAIKEGIFAGFMLFHIHIHPVAVFLPPLDLGRQRWKMLETPCVWLPVAQLRP